MQNANAKPMPAYLSIERDIRRQIRSGALRRGSQLPVELELCRRYAVSRVTLRKALRLLSEEGLILPVTGRGTFVTDPADPELNAVRQRRNELRRSGRTIAALVPSIALAHYPPIIRGAEDECARHGFQLTLGNFDCELKKESEYLRTFMETGVRGVLVSPHYRSHKNAQYRLLQRRGIPLVLTDSPIRSIEADLVATDNVKGAYEGTRRLIEAGCRRIAFLTGWMEASTSQERLAGYRSAMRRAHLRADKALIHEGDFSIEFGYRIWRTALAKQKVDGIFSANDPITTGLLRAMAESGAARRECPVVASFDEPEVPYRFGGRLIIVEQPRYEMGSVACKLLIERLQEQGDARTPEASSRSRENACRKILLSPTVRQLLPAGRRKTKVSA